MKESSLPDSSNHFLRFPFSLNLNDTPERFNNSNSHEQEPWNYAIYSLILACIGLPLNPIDSYSCGLAVRFHNTMRGEFLNALTGSSGKISLHLEQDSDKHDRTEQCMWVTSCRYGRHFVTQYLGFENLPLRQCSWSRGQWFFFRTRMAFICDRARGTYYLILSVSSRLHSPCSCIGWNLCLNGGEVHKLRGAQRVRTDDFIPTLISAVSVFLNENF